MAINRGSGISIGPAITWGQGIGGPGITDRLVLGPPVNTVAPAVSGNLFVGATLSCTTGTWTPAPDSYAYQWYRAPSTAISGATASTYVLQSADIGASIFCRVTATNAAGATPADSNTVGAIAAFALDSIGVAAVGAWSVARILKYSWFAQPMIRLRRSSDSVESDFGADANGDLDTAAITTWLGGANGLVKVIYDQSGNALDLTQTTPGSQPLYSGSLIGGKPGFSIADADDWVVSAAAALDNLTAAGFCLHQVWRSGASLSPQTIWKGFGAAGWKCSGNGSGNYYFVQSGAGNSKYWQRAMAINTSYADTFDYTGGNADNAVTRRTNGSAVANILFGSLTLPLGDDAPYNFSVGSTGAGGVAHDQSEIIIFASVLGSDLQVLNDNATGYYGL